MITTPIRKCPCQVVKIWTVYFRSYWSYKNAFIWTKYVIMSSKLCNNRSNEPLFTFTISRLSFICPFGILYRLFFLFVFVLCTLYCQFLWIVLWLALRYSLPFICFVCLRLVYPLLTVSLDCPSLIGPTVFSNVYLFCLSSSCVPFIVCFSGLSFDWPNGIL
jgi:hypothetical protein